MQIFIFFSPLVSLLVLWLSNRSICILGAPQICWPERAVFDRWTQWTMKRFFDILSFFPSCHSHLWPGTKRVKLAVLSEWEAWLYSLFPVNRSNRSRSWVSVGSCMRKRADERFRLNLLKLPECCSNVVGWLHVMAILFILEVCFVFQDFCLFVVHITTCRRGWKTVQLSTLLWPKLLHKAKRKTGYTAFLWSWTTLVPWILVRSW